MKHFYKISTVVLATAFGLSLATQALADRQPHMESALSSLQAARGQLEHATADKGGHRVKAMGLVDSAIAEVKAGIAFDNHH